VLGGRKTRHAGPPLAPAHVLTQLADQPENALPSVRLENLDGSVHGPVVCCDYEVNPRVQVERDDGLDDVRLVARPEGHHELHSAARNRID